MNSFRIILSLRCVPPVAAAALLFLVPGVESEGATVAWGSPTTISGSADASTTGTSAYAYSFTETAVPTTTVNGITFQTFAVGMILAPLTVGNVTLTPSGFMDGKDTLFGDASAPYSGLSSAYRTLLERGTSDPLNKQFTLTLGGLTSGLTYAVEIWSSASGSANFNTAGSNAKTQIAAGNSVTLDVNNTNAVGGVGQWVIGTFTADAASQVLAFSGPGTDYPILNAMQLRLVPEPSVGLLFSAGALAVVQRRRRRK